MNYPVIILILGMAVVTYLPRALPAVVIERVKLNPKIAKFLRLIPYTAMVALIFPGIINVDSQRPEIGIIGGVAAGILAWMKKPIIVCVITAIAVDMLLYLVF
jgi:branched-subunit amino acid transport protein